LTSQLSLIGLRQAMPAGAGVQGRRTTLEAVMDFG